MTYSKLKVGVAGCGHAGNIHCRILKEISNNNARIEFTGIYDVNSETAKNISSEYGVKNFNSYESLLKEINSLIIATPTSAHFSTAKQALENGVNIFIEKPVTQNLKEARKLMGICKKTKLKVQAGHVERFNPALIALEKYNIQPKFIEAHRLAQFNPRGTDVSVIHDLMIHDIDIILSLVKSPVRNVDANGVAVISNNPDIANARITFRNGCVANLTSSRISLKKMRKMRIFQPNSYITIDFLSNKSEVVTLSDKTSQAGRTISIGGTKNLIFEEPAVPSGNYNPMREELTAFFDSILENKNVKVSLEEGKKAVEISDMIIKIISKKKKT